MIQGLSRVFFLSFSNHLFGNYLHSKRSHRFLVCCFFIYLIAIIKSAFNYNLIVRKRWGESTATMYQKALAKQEWWV